MIDKESELLWEDGDEEGASPRVRIRGEASHWGKSPWHFVSYYEPPELELLKDSLQLLRSEFADLRQSFEFAEDLRRRIASGRAIVLEAEPFEVPDLTAEEIESCKEIILQEIDLNEKVYPSDVSEKHGLEYALVALCFSQLEKDGVIGEAIES